ncbi:MAG: hypothetical protein FJY58_08820 [Betaproteobacteria bacterium]|nr:hypothetical protein [Betaproteobacteria bacterium]
MGRYTGWDPGGYWHPVELGGINLDQFMKYMLDTNIFNVLLDEKIDLDEFPKDAEFIATGI